MKVENKRKAHNKLLPIVCIVIGVILFVVVLFMIINNKKSYDDENHEPDPNDPNYNAIEMPFNKQDIMTLIYQTKEINQDKDNWSVKDASLLAHNEDNSKYLIRYKKLSSDGTEEEYESIVTIHENEKHMDLPGWPINSKDIENFDFIYYTEDAEGYDPENQQYGEQAVNNN